MKAEDNDAMEIEDQNNKDNVVQNDIHNKNSPIDLDKKITHKVEAKPKYKKRTPFEKTVDDVLHSLNSLISSENLDPKQLNSIIGKLEVEKNRRLEHYKMFQVYEKMKDFVGRLSAVNNSALTSDNIQPQLNLVDLNPLNNLVDGKKAISDYKNDFQEIKNILLSHKRKRDNNDTQILKDILTDDENKEEELKKMDNNKNIETINLHDEPNKNKKDNSGLSTNKKKNKKTKNEIQIKKDNDNKNTEPIIDINEDNDKIKINSGEKGKEKAKKSSNKKDKFKDLEKNLKINEFFKPKLKNSLSVHNNHSNVNKERKEVTNNFTNINNTFNNSNNSNNTNIKNNYIIKNDLFNNLLANKNTINDNNLNIETNANNSNTLNNIEYKSLASDQNEFPDNHSINKNNDNSNQNNNNTQNSHDNLSNKISECTNFKQVFPYEESLQDNKRVLKYDPNMIQDNTMEKTSSFYNLAENEIFTDSKNYLEALKSYHLNLQEQNKNAKEANNVNKLIYIHNSFMPIKKIREKESDKINGKYPLKKDEFLIDYAKDSEDEYMEENAEDIKSNDNEDKEEDIDEELGSQQDDNFIVPDGHLSVEELSDKDALEERKIFEQSKNKIKGIIDILEIRRSFNKPIIIDFSKYIKTINNISNMNTDTNNNIASVLCSTNRIEDQVENNNNNNDIQISKDKVNNLINKLTIQIFDTTNIKKDTIADEEKEVQLNFPLKIESIKKHKNKYECVHESLSHHLEEIVKKIHGSFEPRDILITEITGEFKELQKKILKNFFIEQCMKIDNNENKKKFWLVKQDILNVLNLPMEEINRIKEEHLKKYISKMEEKQKELEKIKKDNGIFDSKDIVNNELNTEINKNKNKKKKNKGDNINNSSKKKDKKTSKDKKLKIKKIKKESKSKDNNKMEVEIDILKEDGFDMQKAKMVEHSENVESVKGDSGIKIKKKKKYISKKKPKINNSNNNNNNNINNDNNIGNINDNQNNCNSNINNDNKKSKSSKKKIEPKCISETKNSRQLTITEIFGTKADNPINHQNNEINEINENIENNMQN